MNLITLSSSQKQNAPYKKINNNFSRHHRNMKKRVHIPISKKVFHIYQINILVVFSANSKQSL